MISVYVGQEFENSFAGWFWFTHISSWGYSQTITWRCHHLKVWLEKDPVPSSFMRLLKGLSLLLTLNCRIQFLIMGTSQWACLTVLMMCSLALLRASDLRERENERTQDGSHSLLRLRMTCHHFLCMLLATHINPSTMWEELHGGMDAKRWRSWGWLLSTLIVLLQ